MKINNLFVILRIKADRNGNGRFIVHYSAFLTREEKAAPCDPQAPRAKFNLALSKARRRGGKMYRGRGYPGGIVFQAYTEAEVIATIEAVK